MTDGTTIWCPQDESEWVESMRRELGFDAKWKVLRHLRLQVDASKLKKQLMERRMAEARSALEQRWKRLDAAERDRKGAYLLGEWFMEEPFSSLSTQQYRNLCQRMAGVNPFEEAEG